MGAQARGCGQGFGEGGSVQRRMLFEGGNIVSGGPRCLATSVRPTGQNSPCWPVNALHLKTSSLARNRERQD